MFGISLSGNLFSQNNKADSLYSDYFKSRSTDDKMTRCPGAVSSLCNLRDSKRVYQIIADLEKSKVEPSKESYKKGVILLSKSLITRSVDSVSLSSMYAKQSIPFLSNNKRYMSEAQCMLVMNYNLKGQFDSCIQAGNKFLPDIKRVKKTGIQGI